MEVVTLTRPPVAAAESGEPSTTADPLRAGPYSSLAIGSFDGVHLGHRRVLAGCDTVLTFDPHPRRVLTPRQAPCLLSDQQTKLRKLEALGIRRTAVICFDEAWSRVTAEDFIEQVIIGRLRARIVSVGANFRFGSGGAATPATFADYPTLRTRVTPMVTDRPGGDPISSTRIRRLVSLGEVEAAAGLLGGPLILPASVVADGRLRIGEVFAVPAPADYHGSVDGRPTAIRVRADREVTVLAASRPGATVELAFLQRRG